MKTAPSSLSASWLAHRRAQWPPEAPGPEGWHPQQNFASHPLTPLRTRSFPGALGTRRLYTRACAHSPGRQPCGHCEPGASLGLARPWLLIRTQHHAPGPGMALTQLVQMALCADNSDRWRGALGAQAAFWPRVPGNALTHGLYQTDRAPQ